MKIDKELIEKVAKNVRLKINDYKIKSLVQEIKEILDLFSEIDKAPVSKLKPSFQPLEIRNIMREDKIESCLSQKEALQNTKHKQDGYFKGPKVI